MDNRYIRTNDDIHGAVAAWCTVGREKGTRMFGEIEEWDVSAVTCMKELFADRSDFNDDISRWNVSNVTDMMGMFDNAWRFNQDISRWDVSSVKDMFQMFCYCSLFNQNLSKWDVGNVTIMGSMFFGASAFNENIEGLDRPIWTTEAWRNRITRERWRRRRAFSLMVGGEVVRANRRYWDSSVSAFKLGSPVGPLARVLTTRELAHYISQYIR
jgi:surface protein